MVRRKSNEEFVTSLRAISPSISTVEEYKNCRSKIKVKCEVCEYIWSANPSDLLRGHGCPRCSGKERKTTARFIAEVSSENLDVEVIGEYINTSTKIKTRCKRCGSEWFANPSTLLSGSGCPNCGGTKKKTHESFVTELNSMNPDIDVIGIYKNNRTKVPIKCRRCGNVWSATPHNLLSARTRCPNCTHASTSYMEQFIYEWISEAIGREYVIHRDKTAIGIELDVYVPKLNIAFEPGAWHWHKDKLEMDSYKRKLCAEKGIRLITIYDKVPEKEAFLENDIVLFTFDVRAQKKSAQLADVVCKLINEQGESVDLNEVDLENVINKAYKNSVKTNTDEYIEKLASKGIDVDVIGEYESSSSRIKVKCVKCGHVWAPRADTLLSGGSSCKVCGNVKNGKAHLKSHEIYIDEVETRNPTVEILGIYKKASERIHAKCRICGYEWNPVANSLVRKKPSACPECGKSKMVKTRKKNKDNK